jgi:hypothetical protein
MYGYLVISIYIPNFMTGEIIMLSNTQYILSR